MIGFRLGLTEPEPKTRMDGKGTRCVHAHTPLFVASCQHTVFVLIRLSTYLVLSFKRHIVG